MQLLIVYSVNVSLVVTAFSQLVQFFKYFLHTIEDSNVCLFHSIIRSFKMFIVLKSQRLSWLHAGSHPTLEKLKIIFAVKFISEEI